MTSKYRYVTSLTLMTSLFWMASCLDVTDLKHEIVKPVIFHERQKRDTTRTQVSLKYYHI